MLRYYLVIRMENIISFLQRDNSILSLKQKQKKIGGTVNNYMY